MLPKIMKNRVNICESVEAEIVRFFASFPESKPSSKYVQRQIHGTQGGVANDRIEDALRLNKPVFFRGTPQILQPILSPYMPVSIHDATHPHQKGTISDAVAGMKDPMTIQNLVVLLEPDNAAVPHLQDDANSVATYIHIESGGKLWVFFRPKM
ncbi:hypothetical protein DEU56DRAFT_754122 [Suillus clintonianus]|uniref:uncharacterized protein n=1 Tax=Suillus clintonianus TaxID=1904413 RepID=UPI001B86647C|nr:uncharacterized protein DEU56DRAFT_754122 [Suillus clintonianus]KAG2145264.1 hypothetical protein DEU56DRAFT_754122 [Suillus clintonianus]